MLVVQLISAARAMMCVSEWQAVGCFGESSQVFSTKFSAFSVSQESQVLQFTADVWCFLTCTLWKSFLCKCRSCENRRRGRFPSARW